MNRDSQSTLLPHHRRHPFSNTQRSRARDGSFKPSLAGGWSRWPYGQPSPHIWHRCSEPWPLTEEASHGCPKPWPRKILQLADSFQRLEWTGISRWKSGFTALWLPWQMPPKRYGRPLPVRHFQPPPPPWPHDEKHPKGRMVSSAWGAIQFFPGSRRPGRLRQCLRFAAGAFAFVLFQVALAHAQAGGGDFQQLVIVDELHAVLQ